MISTDGAQRIELTALRPRRDALQRRIAGHRGSQMRASHASTPRRTPRPRGSCARRSSSSPVALERAHGAPRAHPRAPGTFSPRSASVSRIAGRPSGSVEGDDRAHLVEHRLRRRVIHLVDRDHVGDLHDPGLQRLHGVARSGHEDEEDGVRDPGRPRPRSARLRPSRRRPRPCRRRRGAGPPAASPRRARRDARASPSSG